MTDDNIETADPKPLPLAVRLRDEAGPPLPQMVAQRRAQMVAHQAGKEKPGLGRVNLDLEHFGLFVTIAE